jgi:GTPase involved in cell partitioning and DNA repair
MSRCGPLFLAPDKLLFLVGGNGGRGGDVIFMASSKVYDLGGITTTVRGEKGGPGTSKNQVGSRGRDKIVMVPVGTVVRKFQGREQEPEGLAAVAELADSDWRAWGDDEFEKRESRGQDVIDTEEESAHVVEDDRVGDGQAVSLDRGESSAKEEQEEGVTSDSAHLQEGISMAERHVASAESDYPQHTPHSWGKNGLESGPVKANNGEDLNQSGVGWQGPGPDSSSEAQSPFRASKGSGSRIKGPVIVDLTEAGQKYVAAVGGCGGKGNAATGRKGEKPWFKRKAGQLQINEHETGEHGQQMWLELELKTLADVGLGTPAFFLYWGIVCRVC